MAYKGVTDKRNPHTGTGDVVGSHLLIQLQNDSWRKTIGLDRDVCFASGIIFLFQQNKGFIFKLLRGTGAVFRPESAAADLLHRKLDSFQNAG